MDMLMQIVLVLLEFVVADDEGITDIVGNRIIVGKVANFVNGVADLFVLAMQFFQ